MFISRRDRKKCPGSARIWKLVIKTIEKLNAVETFKGDKVIGKTQIPHWFVTEILYDLRKKDYLDKKLEW